MPNLANRVSIIALAVLKRSLGSKLMRNIYTKFLNVIAILSPALLGLVFAAPAHAHHVMDGQLPNTFMQGLLSGIGHPIIGLDHLAFVIGIGLIAAAVPRGLPVLGAFVGGALLGCVVHLFSVNLPIAELVIALSVILAGAVLVFRPPVTTAIFAGGIAIVGVFHGYAYGEAIVGAEASALGAYLLGFSIIQFSIAAAACYMVGFLKAKPVSWAENGVQLAGAVIGVFGVYVLTNQFIA
jgi:urease accessory protein